MINLEEKHVINLIENFYGLKINQSQVILLSSSFAKSYKIINPIATIVVKVFSEEYKTKKDALSELKLLLELLSNNVKVIIPKSGVNRDFILELNQIQNGYFAIAYEYFEGEVIPKLNKVQSFNLGVNLANIHKFSINPNLELDKTEYTIGYLFDDSYKLIRPFLGDSQKEYLNKLRDKIQLQLELINLEINNENYGICHGDYISRNSLWKNEKECLTIDFEFVSRGYRAYDMSHFKWELVYCKYEKTYTDNIWEEFLKGYNSIRVIQDNENKMINISMLLYHIFMAGERVKLSKVLGEHLLAKQFWDRCMEFLYENEKDIL